MSDASLPGRVLIVGANYWPEESGNAPYTTGAAEDLAARGSDVTVLCAMPHYPQWRIRDGYRGHVRVREVRRGVRVIRSWLWVPTRQSAFQRALFEGSFLISSLTARGMPQPEVVIGVTPSLSGAVLARILARRSRVPYGLMVQDLVGPGAKQSGMRGGHEVAGAVRAMEGWAFSGAAGVGIVSEGFRPYVHELGVADGRVTHVPNWVHIARSEADPASVRQRLGLPHGTVVLHAGAMGLKQGLEQVVDAARLDQERGGSLYFVLAGDGSQRDLLEARAEGLRNIFFLPQRPADRYADLLIASDVLLLSERPEMVNMSLPGKLTSYVTAGKPIVAAVASGGATAAEVERSGAGIVTRAGDPAALVAALDRVSTSPEVAVALTEAARAYERSLDKDVCLERMRELVGAVGERGGP